MGHFVTGIIVKVEDAEAVTSRIPFKSYSLLKQGFVIFPLTDDLLDEKISAPQNFSFDEFTYLSAELAQMISGASAGTRIAYIETEYHGGQGRQSAIVFSDSAVICRPKQADVGPISQALEQLGVIKEPGHQDEFQSVGLGGFRSSEELLKPMR